MYQYPSPDEPSYGSMPTGQAEWSKGVIGGLKLAPWKWRAAAALVDYLPLFVLAEMVAAASATLAWLLLIVVLGVNSVILPSVTGQSFGKQLFGLKLAVPVIPRGGGQELVLPGVVRTFCRLFAHWFDLLIGPPLCIGFLRPLWQTYHRTWADSMAKTVVLFREDVLIERRPRGAKTWKL
jgi:hypothetical protein